MPKNDLTQPIPGATAPRPPVQRRSVVAPILISTAVVVALFAALWIAVVDNPDGGHPVAVASIEAAVPAATGSIAPSGDTQSSLQQPAAQSSSDDLQLAALPMLPPAIAGDPSLIETSSYGPLPRVSPDGRRPREAYARRSAPVPEGVPRIVIVVGGLGLSQTGTQKAIEVLPEDVTLAFAPYGSSLERWVSKAREKGHEVLLQIPLEPMDYPDVNPGEHTLLVAGGAANREDLHWVLGRMTAYAGVMNHMGARFLQDEHVGGAVPRRDRRTRPLLPRRRNGGAGRRREGRRRGSKVPVVIAERTLDRVRTPSAIESELAGLEQTARARGLAVGVASAFPTSVEAIAKWARDAEARGIIIIPASAAANS